MLRQKPKPRTRWREGEYEEEEEEEKRNRSTDTDWVENDYRGKERKSFEAIGRILPIIISLVLFDHIFC